MLTRRTAIWTGGSALLLAGCGGRPARTIAGDTGDLDVLRRALEVERAQIALYQAGVALLDGRSRRIARAILAQERTHAGAIAESIRELGAAPPGARPAAEYERGIPADASAWLEHAISAEEGYAAAYAAALPRMANKRLRATFGALMTSEAEHAVALGLR